MKRMLKRLLAVLLFVCMLATFTGCNLFAYGAVVIGCLLPDRVKNREGIEHYQKDCKDFAEAADWMPDPVQIPDGEVVYHCRTREYGIFASTGMSLFVTYPEDLYEEKKAAVLSEYEFLDAPVGERILPAAEFPYKTFQMKVTKNGGEDWTACKTIYMIGCDDAAHRIAYCLMIDRDLDYIGETDEDPVAAMQRHMDLWFYWIS